MTLVDAETGEIVEDMDGAKARYMTDEIKADLSNIWSDIEELYAGRAWKALGYGSWDEYCSEEFGASRIKLPSEERREVVSSLRDAGLSTRAIAAATGTSARTVRRDLGGASAPPESGNHGSRDVMPNFKPSQIKGTDGKSYSKTTTRKSESVTTEKPEPVGPEPVKQATENLADSDVAYREKFSKARVDAHKLLRLDPERCADLSDRTNPAAEDQFIEMVRRWIDTFDEALHDKPKLRSVN